MSTENPWKVDNIKAFSFLNCPECSFKIKDENSFQNHAVKNHPLSSVLFDGKLVKEGNAESVNESRINLNIKFSKSELSTVFDILNSIIATSKIKPKSFNDVGNKTLEDIMFPDFDDKNTTSTEQQCSDFVFKFKREISNALVSVGKAPPVNLFPKETQPIRRTPIDVRASSEFQIVDVNSLIKKSSPIATIPTLKGPKRPVEEILIDSDDDDDLQEIPGNSKKQFHGPQQPGPFGVKKIIPKKIAEPGKVVYSCKFCDFTFFNMKTLQDHMEKKSCQKLFKCTKCSKEFTKKPDLTNHITLIHGNVTPVVNSVGREKTNKAIHLSSKNNLSRTIQDESTSTKSPQKKKAAVGFGEAYKGFLKTHVTPKIKCQYCSEPFPDIKQVVAHYNEKHKKNFDICGYCNFITTSETLAKHMFTCKKNPKYLNPGASGSSKNGTAAGDKTEISRKGDKSVIISPIRIIDVKSNNQSGDKTIKNDSISHKIGDKNHSVKIGENSGEEIGDKIGDKIGENSGEESDDQAAGDK